VSRRLARPRGRLGGGGGTTIFLFYIARNNKKEEDIRSRGRKTARKGRESEGYRERPRTSKGQGENGPGFTKSQNWGRKLYGGTRVFGKKEKTRWHLKWLGKKKKYSRIKARRGKPSSWRPREITVFMQFTRRGNRVTPIKTTSKKKVLMGAKKR